MRKPEPAYVELRVRMPQWLAIVLLVILGILLVLGMYVVTSPNLDALPAYECNPGSHHTTKECQ